MTSVALVGVDGAGKTTIARRLLKSFPLPVKYIYMGTSILSSNFALPTSRLILYLKLRSYQKTSKQSGHTPPESLSNHDLEYRNVTRSMIGATARTLNRMAEECYRQVMAWCYQIRGYIVLYDRHFLFEYTPKVQKQNQRLSDCIHLWFLQKLYPRPNLVFFMDAPLEVLLRRKNECPQDHLQKQRQALREQAKEMDDIVYIDASRSQERVYEEVSEQIIHYIADKYPNGQLSRILKKKERRIQHE